MDFSDLLHRELRRRQQANPRYSLRAFAKYLNLDPSSLSQIIRGKRALTPALIEKVGGRLGIRGGELVSWIELTKETKLTPQDLQLREDEFKLIADWYHYALFELIMVEDFNPAYPWISAHLGISRSEAKSAVERLIRLGIFIRDEGGGLKRTTPHLTTQHHPFSNSAFRSMQHQMLSMGHEALEGTPYEEREQCALTIAARKSDLPEIREKIRKFHRGLNDWIEKRGKADCVYHLATTYYPVTKSRGKK